MKENMNVESWDISDWVQFGIEKGWVFEPFCYTHDGDPHMTEEEEAEWEEGGDPCCHVIKFVQ
jgi:hypothetical protein